MKRVILQPSHAFRILVFWILQQLGRRCTISCWIFCQTIDSSPGVVWQNIQEPLSTSPYFEIVGQHYGTFSAVCSAKPNTGCIESSLGMVLQKIQEPLTTD